LEGDLNTKFFHTIANNRKGKNSIFFVNINNTIIYDQDTIRSYIQEYYKKLIGTTNDIILTLDMNLWSQDEKLNLDQSSILEE
jgi:hypothetical protein